MNDEKNCKVFADNLHLYMSINNVSSKELASILEVPTSTFSCWYKGQAYPRIDKIQKMADYFGIKKSDLIEPHDSTTENQLSPAREKLLAMVKDMSDEDITKLLDIIRAVKGMR